MSKDIKNQISTMNSYTRIPRSLGPSKTGCAKCDAKNLPVCMCSQNSSEENLSKKVVSPLTEETKNADVLQQFCASSVLCFKKNHNISDKSLIVMLSNLQNNFQFTLKPNVTLDDIKALLKQFILDLDNNDHIDILESEEKPSIYYDASQNNILAITFNHTKIFSSFVNLLIDKSFIDMTQNQLREIESITQENIAYSFSPSPFSMTLKPF